MFDSLTDLTILAEMKDTRLIEILASFSRDEMKAFRKFLDSPFVKSRRNIASLLDALAGYHPEFRAKEISKEKIYGKLFAGEPFNSKKLENLTLDLAAAAEGFLIHQAVESDEVEKMIYLSHGYSDRKLMSHSFRILKKIESSPKLISSRGQSYYSLMRRINFMKSSYYMNENDFGSNIDCVRKIFQSSALQLLTDYALYQSVKKPALTTYNIKLEDEVFDPFVSGADIEKLAERLAASDEVNSLPAILSYYKLRTVYEPDVHKYYFDLRQIFYDNIDRFDREEKHITFSHMANYCVQNFLKGNQSFKQEGLGVYKKMMKHDAYSLSENEYMQTLTFRNVVQFCITNKDSGWLEEFLNNYSATLPPDEREDRKNYSYAQLYFINKDFERALENASKVRKEFFLFKTDDKNLLLKIYYELGHYEAAFSMVDSYRHFLAKSKEISGSHKETFRNFLNHYHSLLKLRSMQSREDPKFIRSKIESEQSIVSKSWLLQKSDELINAN